HQTLAKAAWDWGFGDWEDALGAASHVGNREIAELLLANGARPTIFSAALVKPAAARGPPPSAVGAYLSSIGGADEKPAEQPLSAADIAKLTGVYSFGPTPAGRIEITVNKEQLSIARPGQFPRGLFHLGSFEFCPVGAE